ncbi:hypothetical protein Droror1_Dr00008690 [Drosera rotundifolia]
MSFNGHHLHRKPKVCYYVSYWNVCEALLLSYSGVITHETKELRYENLLCVDVAVGKHTKAESSRDGKFEAEPQAHVDLPSAFHVTAISSARFSSDVFEFRNLMSRTGESLDKACQHSYEVQRRAFTASGYIYVACQHSYEVQSRAFTASGYIYEVQGRASTLFSSVWVALLHLLPGPLVRFMKGDGPDLDGCAGLADCCCFPCEPLPSLFSSVRAALLHLLLGPLVVFMKGDGPDLVRGNHGDGVVVGHLIGPAAFLSPGWLRWACGLLLLPLLSAAFGGLSIASNPLEIIHDKSWWASRNGLGWAWQRGFHPLCSSAKYKQTSWARWGAEHLHAGHENAGHGNVGHTLFEVFSSTKPQIHEEAGYGDAGHWDAGHEHARRRPC